MRVGGDRLRVVRTLEDVANSAVANVEAPGVTSVQELHSAREGERVGLEQQVIVVRHQAEHMAAPLPLHHERSMHLTLGTQMTRLGRDIVATQSIQRLQPAGKQVAAPCQSILIAACLTCVYSSIE